MSSNKYTSSAHTHSPQLHVCVLHNGRYGSSIKIRCKKCSILSRALMASQQQAAGRALLRYTSVAKGKKVLLLMLICQYGMGAHPFATLNDTGTYTTYIICSRRGKDLRERGRASERYFKRAAMECGIQITRLALWPAYL